MRLRSSSSRNMGAHGSRADEFAAPVPSEPVVATMTVILRCRGCRPVSFAVSGLPADLGTVDRLLRLVLRARRAGLGVQVHVDGDLWPLLHLAGVTHLGGVAPLDGAARAAPPQRSPWGSDSMRGGRPTSAKRSG